MNNEPKEVTPALDFIGDQALVAVPSVEFIDDQVKEQVYVITSARSRFLLANVELISRGYYMLRHPSPSQRWSRQSLEDYLAGEPAADLKEVFGWVVEQLNHYIDFGDQRVMKLMACWIIGTYFHRLFTAYPYVHLNGTMESGKSKTLSIVSQLAFNGELTVNSTPAFIVRVVNDNQSTCCIDEIENLWRAKDEDSKAVIGMYNAGYKKGSVIGKTEQSGRNKQWRPKRYDPYCPKIFASINGLEASLASRTIPIEMVRSNNNKVKNREVLAEDETLSGIRDRLYPAMFENFPMVKAIYDGINDEVILGREWELWKPILAIATVIDPEHQLRDELHGLAVETGNNKKETVLEGLVTPKLLRALQTLLISELNGEGMYSCATILNHLIEYDKESFGWLLDYQSSGRWLGNELRKAGVVTGAAKLHRINGESVKAFQLNVDSIARRLRAFE